MASATDEAASLEQLETHLRLRLPLLCGDWLRQDSNYDAPLSALLEMECEPSRYWARTWRLLYLELKKGRRIWLDLVRYSEIMLKTSDLASRQTLTLFFVPDAPVAKIKKSCA